MSSGAGHALAEKPHWQILGVKKKTGENKQRRKKLVSIIFDAVADFQVEIPVELGQNLCTLSSCPPMVITGLIKAGLAQSPGPWILPGSGAALPLLLLEPQDQESSA